MQTITDKLQILKDNAEDIRKALSDKVGYDVGPMLKDYSKIITDIKSSVSGEPDVNFYDYDGTLLYAYTKDEFLSLSELPELPSQPGLVCQEWNWTLEDAKTYVQEYGRLNIGATYITDDGKTRLYINLLNDGMTIPLYIDQSDDNGVTVDWGDGTNTETISGTGGVIFDHTYENPGSYTISLKVDSGTCTLGHNSDSYNVIGSVNTIASGSLYKAEIGSNMSIGDGAFYTCHSLQSVTIPNSINSIGMGVFNNCFSLQSITIPNSVNSIGGGAFNGCYSLTSITIPNSVTSIGDYAFNGCSSLTSITIPNSVTSIGEYAFSYCSLQSVTIPNSVTSIGDYAFSGCSSLTSITIPNSVTSIGDYAFSGCYSLTSITIPNSVTSIGSDAFSYCSSLQSITIPDSVNSIWDAAFIYCFSLTSITIPNSVTSIGDYAFSECYSLSSITIPDSVTNIGDSTFYNCHSMQYYDFTSHTSIPTLSNTDAFGGISDGCEIRVPTSLYWSWMAATNWSNYADYIVPYKNGEPGYPGSSGGSSD